METTLNAVKSNCNALGEGFFLSSSFFIVGFIGLGGNSFPAVVLCPRLVGWESAKKCRSAYPRVTKAVRLCKFSACQLRKCLINESAGRREVLVLRIRCISLSCV